MVRVRKSDSVSGQLQVPVRLPQGDTGYQVWEHAFSKQRPRGALREVEKAHWAPVP